MEEDLMKDRQPHKLEDPSLVEVGQVWDFVGEGGDLLVLVLETCDSPSTPLDPEGRRNANVLVLDNSQHDDGFSEGKVISYSEKHLCRHFKRVS